MEVRSSNKQENRMFPTNSVAGWVKNKLNTTKEVLSEGNK